MKLIAYKGYVSIDPASIVDRKLKSALSEIETIVNNDALYSKICVFIFLQCDLSNDNPLVDRPYNKRKEDALEVAFGGDLEEFVKLKDAQDGKLRDAINQAIGIYVKYINTDEQKDIATYSKKMDQFRVMLEGMKPTIEKNTHEATGMVSYSTNIEIINSVLRDVVALIQAKASMIALHTTGSIPKHLRGGLSPLTKGKIDLIEE